MTDWAIEIAVNQIYDGLCRAKADGMREAADLIKAHRHAAPKLYWKPGEKALFNKIDSLLRDHASKLEADH